MLSILKGQPMRLATWMLLALTLVVALLATPAYAITRDINIVYDNSGSMMYGDVESASDTIPQDTWSKALYALNVVAAMLGEEGTVKVYDISDTGQDPFLVIRGTESIDERVDKIARDWGYKISTTTSKAHVEAAYADLATRSTADQKWLVIITDGNFEDTTPEEMAAWFQQGTAEYPGLAQSGVNVIYMTIGSKERDLPLRSDLYGSLLVDLTATTELESGSHIYQISAEDTADILADMQLIVNFMLGRHALPAQDMSYDGSTLTITTSVAMKDLVVFAQGDSVAIGDLQDASGKAVPGGTAASKTIQHADYTEAGNDDMGIWAHLWDGSSVGWYYTIDTSLSGCVASYSGFSQTPGEGNVYTYTIPVWGVASVSDISVYYLPDVYPVVVFTDSNGVVQATFQGKEGANQDQKSLPVGTYTVELQLWDAVSDVPIDGDSVKMSGQTITFTKEGDPDNPIVADPDHPQVSFGQQTFAEVKVSAVILDDTNVEFAFTNVQTKIYVPDWQGCTYDQYEAMLANLGLVAQRGDHAAMADDPSGTQDNMVVGISGASIGDSVDEGTVITVDYLEPYEGVTIPDVTGMNIDEAAQKVESAGLVALKTAGSEEAPDQSQQDCVYGVASHDDPSIGVGAEVKKGSTVVLTYYSTTVQLTVPDVVGLDKDAALAALTAAGFTLEDHDGDVAPDVSQVGLAYGQKPSAGETASSGSAVSVTFYSLTDVAQATIPAGLYQMTYEEAVAAIEAAGLVAEAPAPSETLEAADDPEQVAKVYGASVAGTPKNPGDEVSKGSVVTVYAHQGIIVPDISTMTYEEASAELGKYGLVVSEAPSNEMEPAATIDECLLVYKMQLGDGTAVTAGDVVAEGSSLTLFHHATVLLPSGLIGANYQDAVSALEGLGLGVEVASDLKDATGSEQMSLVYEVVSAGTVLLDEASPDAEVAVPCGETLTLGYYANMLEVQIPEVDGRSYTDYCDLLEQLGFVDVTATAVEAPNIQTGDLSSVGSVTPEPGTVCEVTEPITVEYYGSYAMVEVPSVVGMKREDVQKTFGDSLILVEGSASEDAPSIEYENQAFGESDPVSGTQVPVGTSVTVNFYGGAAEVTIPADVWGMTYEEAATLLQSEAYGLIVVDVPGEAAANPADDRKVLSVAAESGDELDEKTPVKKGSTVQVAHYEGLAGIEVPDVSTLDADEARALLSAAPYYFAVADEALTGDSSCYGQIPGVTVQGTDQDGKTISVGSAIAIKTFGDYALTQVPDLAGMTVDEAEKALAAARLVIAGSTVGNKAAIVDNPSAPEGEGHVYEWELDQTGVDAKGRAMPATVESGDVIQGAPVDLVVYDSYVAPLELTVSGDAEVVDNGIDGYVLTVAVTREGQPMTDAEWAKVSSDLDGISGTAGWIQWKVTKGNDSTYQITARPTGWRSWYGVRLVHAFLFGNDNTLEIQPTKTLYVNEKGQEAGSVNSPFKFRIAPTFDLRDVIALVVFTLIVGVILNRIIMMATRKKLGTIVITKVTRYYADRNFSVQDGPDVPAVVPPAHRMGFEGSFWAPMNYHQLAEASGVTIGDEGCSFRFGPFKIKAVTNSEAVVTNAKQLRVGEGWIDLSSKQVGQWRGKLRRGAPAVFTFRSDGSDGTYAEVVITIEHRARSTR